LPTLDRSIYAPANGLQKGGYILARESSELKAVVIASGSEVPLALKAREALEVNGIGVRVVSLPSWELFEKQDRDYIDAVLPPDCTRRVAVEAASTFGWERYVGRCGKVIGMTGFGASGPGGALMEHFGFTVENVVSQVKELL